MKRIQSQSSRMLTTTQEPLEESQDSPTMEDCLKIVQNMASETSLIKAYNAFQSGTVRASLNIPGEIWHKLEPELKDRINSIKAEIRKKRAEKKPREEPLPPQYSTAALVNTMLANSSGAIRPLREERT